MNWLTNLFFSIVIAITSLFGSHFPSVDNSSGTNVQSTIISLLPAQGIAIIATSTTLTLQPTRDITTTSPISSTFKKAATDALTVAATATTSSSVKGLSVSSSGDLVTVPFVSNLSKLIDHGLAEPSQFLPHLELITTFSSSSQYIRPKLTPLEYANIFYIPYTDFDRVISWLQSAGFNVNTSLATSTTNRGFLISFGGTVQQVDNTFHITLHAYSSSDGTPCVGTTQNIQVPAYVASLITDNGTPLNLGTCAMATPAGAVVF